MAFTNLNECKNHTCVVGATDWRALSSTECSELYIYSATAFDIYDGNESFRVPATGGPNAFGTYTTFRGLTRASDLSAKSSSGTITVYYRTQFYSGLMQVTG